MKVLVVKRHIVCPRRVDLCEVREFYILVSIVTMGSTRVYREEENDGEIVNLADSRMYRLCEYLTTLSILVARVVLVEYDEAL